MSISFQNKVAVVTGGASGIGSATVELLCELGARVAILDLNKEQGQLLAERLTTRGHAASFHACDVANVESVESAIEAAVRHHGALHVLVHSAGIQRYGDVVSASLETWHETFAVHVDGCFHAMRFALPHIVAAGGGSVVIVGSVQTVTAVAASRPTSLPSMRSPGWLALLRSILPGATCALIALCPAPSIRPCSGGRPTSRQTRKPYSMAALGRTRSAASHSLSRSRAPLRFWPATGLRLLPAQHFPSMEACWCRLEAWAFKKAEQDR